MRTSMGRSRRRARPSLRGLTAGLALGVALGMSVSCTTGAKKEAAKTALDAMPRQERLDTFEATARILDEHPELVDELYAAVRHHGPMLDRFFFDAAPDLANKPMAEIAAKHLVANPEALEQVLMTSTDLIVRVPAARAAMNRAIASRAEEVSDILSSDPATMSRVVEANLLMLEKKPQARRSAVIALRKNRQRVLALIKDDPELTKEMGEEVLREAVKDKPALEKALRAAKIIDDDAVRR
jgi:hypothetical protein